MSAGFRYTPDGVARYTRMSDACVPKLFPEIVRVPPDEENDPVDGCTYGVTVDAVIDPICTAAPKWELPYVECDTTALSEPTATAFVSPTLTRRRVSVHTSTAAEEREGANFTEIALRSVLNLDPMISTKFPALLRDTLYDFAVTTGITATTVATVVSALFTPFTDTITFSAPTFRSVNPLNRTVNPVDENEPRLVSTDASTMVPAEGVTYTRTSDGVVPKLLPLIVNGVR